MSDMTLPYRASDALAWRGLCHGSRIWWSHFFLAGFFLFGMFDRSQLGTSRSRSIQQVLHQQSHRAARGTLGGTALPGGASNVQVSPRRGADEALQKFSSRNDPSRTPSNIGHI